MTAAVTVVVALACAACSSPPPDDDDERRCTYRAFTIEVNAMFAELQIKEENIKVERGTYVPLSAFPTGASSAMPADWVPLRIMLPAQPRHCVFTVDAGMPSDPVPICAVRGGIGAHPNQPWFYVSATCRAPGYTATYFASSANHMTRSAPAAAAARTHVWCGPGR